MIIIDHIEQGSEEWHHARMGVITASRADEFAIESKRAPVPESLKFEKDGKVNKITFANKTYEGTNKTELVNEIRDTLPRVFGDMRQGYMAELVAQVCTGLIPEEMSFKQCEWGKENEDNARAYFEFETGLKVDEVAFIYRDDVKRFGISPDGLISGKKIGLELKCPFTTKVFVEFATCDKIKKEYIEQCQYSMWVTGYDAWYFANYDPRLKNKKLHHVLMERDQTYMDKYDKAKVDFIKDMDSMLDLMGSEFGEQWQ